MTAPGNSVGRHSPMCGDTRQLHGQALTHVWRCQAAAWGGTHPCIEALSNFVGRYLPMCGDHRQLHGEALTHVWKPQAALWESALQGP